jgi:prevent-host-death family protein
MKRNTKEVGLFEAKTRLSALVAMVQRGEEITITKHGVPVARLIPARDVVRRNSKQAAAKIRELRRGIVLGDVSLRSLIEEGRL